MNERNIPGPTSALQEVFDFVVARLREQGERSVVPDSSFTHGRYVCAYRGEGGRKCAAGHLIPDDQHDPRTEGFRIHHVPFFADWPAAHLDLVTRLQSIHDVAEPSRWEVLWEEQARHLGLGYTPPFPPAN